MKPSLKGFLCTSDTEFFVENSHEISLFLNTLIAIEETEPYVEDLPKLLAKLDSEVKSRFSPELEVTAVDAESLLTDTRYSDEIYLVLSPIADITVH